MNMFQKFWGCIELSAALTSFQRMPSDDLVPYFDRSDVFVVFSHDHFCRTDIRASTASYAEALDGHDIIRTISFFHFKRAGSHNFFAHPDAQVTADTSVWRGARIDIVGSRKCNNSFGLGRHLQQILKSPCSGFFN